MSYNNQTNAACQFGEQIVSYIYDECATSEKSKFESHLSNCSHCADELSAFGYVRSSIHEWRSADFAVLPTPVFAIPTNKHENVQLNSVKSNAWLETVRQYLSFNPTFAFGALAVLFVCAGITFFVLNFSGNGDIAENNRLKNSNNLILTPTAEITKKPSDEKADKTRDAEFSAISNISKEANDQSLAESKKGEPKKSITSVNSAIKVTDKSRTNNLSSPAEKTKVVNDKAVVPVKKQAIPNVNETDEEDADDTIRLADLFDELDTK
jgi:hypothetical protein